MIVCNPSLGELVAFDSYLNSIGRSRPTGWRWRKKGYLGTVNIAGREYVTKTAIADFERRAVAGEFKRPVVGAAKAAAEGKLVSCS